jgi:ferritin-like protein|tara:strand:- start:383 stop:556 length:174 start_codon:yes stop_codon:yes gene_type:complete
MENQALIDDGKQRKSLAVDVKTYDLLQDICNQEHRSKIDQLKVLIEKEHKRLTTAVV